MPNPLPTGLLGAAGTARIARQQAKPTPGFEPGTPSLRVKCSGQLSYVGEISTSIGMGETAAAIRSRHPIPSSSRYWSSEAASARQLGARAPAGRGRRHARRTACRHSGQARSERSHALARPGRRDRLSSLRRRPPQPRFLPRSGCVPHSARAGSRVRRDVRDGRAPSDRRRRDPRS